MLLPATVTVEIPGWAVVVGSTLLPILGAALWKLTRRTARAELNLAVREAMKADSAAVRELIAEWFREEFRMLRELHGIPAALESLAKSSSESAKRQGQVRIKVARIEERIVSLEKSAISGPQLASELSEALVTALAPHLRHQ